MSTRSVSNSSCLYYIRTLNDPQEKRKQSQNYFRTILQILGHERCKKLRKESSFNFQRGAEFINSSSDPDQGKADVTLYLNESLLHVLAQKVLTAFMKKYPELPPSPLYHALITSFASPKIFELLNSESSLSHFCTYYVLEALAAWNSSGDRGSLIHGEVSPFFAVKEFQFSRA